MIVYLVGPRACGKTSIGRTLAAALGAEFADTDCVLGEACGMDTATVVAREGWDSFRARESDALRAASQPGRIIATGGGIVLSADNRAYMRENGTVLYLSAPAKVLISRLKAGPDFANRPSLTGKSITDEVVDILAQREALYRDVAHHVVDASGTPDTVLARAVDVLQSNAK